MNKSYIILLIVLMLGIISWFLLWPAIQDISKSSQSLNDWQAKLADAQAAKNNLASLQDKYRSLQNKIDQLDQALPAQKDLPGLLVQIDSLAAQSGLVLNSVNFTSLSPASSDNGIASVQASSALAMKTMKVSLTLSGNYTGLKNFLVALENNLRLSDVNSTSLTVESAGAAAGVSGKMNIEFSIYFKS